MTRARFSVTTHGCDDVDIEDHVMCVPYVYPSVILNRCGHACATYWIPGCCQCLYQSGGCEICRHRRSRTGSATGGAHPAP